METPLSNFLIEDTSEDNKLSTLENTEFNTSFNDEDRIIQNNADNRIISFFEVNDNNRSFYADSRLSDLDLIFLNSILIGLNNTESQIDADTKMNLVEEIELVMKQILKEANETLTLPTTEKNKDCFQIIKDNIERCNQLLFNVSVLVEKNQIFPERLKSENTQPASFRPRLNLKKSNWFHSN